MLVILENKPTLSKLLDQSWTSSLVRKETIRLGLGFLTEPFIRNGSDPKWIWFGFFILSDGSLLLILVGIGSIFGYYPESDRIPV